MAEELIAKDVDIKAALVAGESANVLAEVRKIVGTMVFDLSSAKGRRECASCAARVAKTKVIFDNARKEIVSEWKTKARAIDHQGKILRDGFDKIRDEVRAPLTEWEENKKRMTALRVDSIENIRALGASSDRHTGRDYTAAELEDRCALLSEIPPPDDWYGEFFEQAQSVYEFANNNLTAALVARKHQEQVDRQEAERAERDRVAAAEAAKAAELQQIELQKAKAVADALKAAEVEKAEELKRALYERDLAAKKMLEKAEEKASRELERKTKEAADNATIEVEARLTAESLDAIPSPVAIDSTSDVAAELNRQFDADGELIDPQEYADAVKGLSSAAAISFLAAQHTVDTIIAGTPHLAFVK